MAISFKVLVVDDEQVIRDLICDVLGGEGHVVRTASCGEDALALLRKEKFDALFSDIRMPGMGGLEMLRRAKRVNPGLAAVMMTGFATIETAVEAIKIGASDFITKPILNPAQVPVILKKAIEFQKVRSELAALREINNLHEEFLALLSHEMRTPLTNICGSIEALTSIYKDGLSQEVLEMIDCTAQSVDHMKNVVENLLTAAELQTGRTVLSTQKVDLNRFLADLLRGFVPKAERPAVEKKFQPCDGELYALIDTTLMERAITNILDNAVKFNKETRRLEITISTFREADRIRFCIRNDGKPIAAEHFDGVFRKFKQADHYMTRRVGGLGLGLPIAKAILQKHGGDVAIDETRQEGVTFAFTLPAQDESECCSNICGEEQAGE